MLDKKMEKILCLTSAYNESKYLHKLIKQLNKICIKTVVVDDGSTDNTKKVLLNEDIKSISNPFNLGKGESLKKGYEYILDSNIDYKYVLLIDSDLQHDPNEIEDLLKQLKLHDSDQVIGSRDFLNSKMPLERKIWNYLVSLIHRKIFIINILDSQSGYRLYTKKAFLEIFKKIGQKGYSIETEINFISHDLGIITVEQPISTIYQAEKVGNDKFITLFIRMLQISQYIFGRFFSRYISKHALTLIYFLIFISTIMYGYKLYLNTRPTLNSSKQTSYASGYLEATEWLKNNTDTNSVILTEWTEGHQVVLLTNRRVIATSKVYPTEANEIASRYTDLAIFFFSNNKTKIIEVLNKHKASYIFIRRNFDFKSSCKNILKCDNKNEFLKSLLTGDVEKYSFIKKVFDGSQILIYKYK